MKIITVQVLPFIVQNVRLIVDFFLWFLFKTLLEEMPEYKIGLVCKISRLKKNTKKKK